MYENVLFPTDGSDGSEAALEHALSLAETYDARLHVVYVADTARHSVTVVEGQAIDALEQEGEGIVESAAERARERGVKVFDEVVQGDPAATIVDYAGRADVDLIVMGTHGSRGIGDRLLGSVTDRVLRTGNVPVLAVQVGE